MMDATRVTEPPAKRARDGAPEANEAGERNARIAEFWNRDVAPRLAALEARRRRAILALAVHSLVAVVGTVLIVGGAFELLPWESTIPGASAIATGVFIGLAGGIVATAAALVGFVLLPLIRFARARKIELLPEILERYYPVCRYQALSQPGEWPVGETDRWALSGSLILPSFDDCEAEDIISGEVDGIAFRFCELSIYRTEEQIVYAYSAALRVPYQQQQAVKKDVFHGFMLHLTMSATAPGRITAFPRDRIPHVQGEIEALSPVLTGIPQFDHVFEIRCDRPDLTRQWLGANLLHQVLALQEQRQAEDFAFAAFGRHFLLRARTERNRFESAGRVLRQLDIDDAKRLLGDLEDTVGIARQLGPLLPTKRPDP